MRAQSIHHIGHAVDDLDAAIATYQQLLGGVLEHRETVPDQGVEAATMLLGDGRVELLRPLGDDTPVGKFLQNRGPGMHHMALRRLEPRCHSAVRRIAAAEKIVVLVQVIRTGVAVVGLPVVGRHAVTAGA